MHSRPGRLPNPTDVDPLQQVDPWAAPARAKRQALNEINTEELVSQVEQRIKASLLHVGDPPDEAMVDDSRLRELETKMNQLGELESRMNQLEVTVQGQHHEQAQRNHALAQQIQCMSTKIDTQASAYQTILDQRMQEQLTQIERLISNGKKARTE